MSQSWSTLRFQSILHYIYVYLIYTIQYMQPSYIYIHMPVYACTLKCTMDSMDSMVKSMQNSHLFTSHGSATPWPWIFPPGDSQGINDLENQVKDFLTKALQVRSAFFCAQRGRQVVIRMGPSKKEELVDWSIVTSKRTCKNSELREHLWPYSTFSCKLQVKWSYMTFPIFFLGYYTKNRDFTNKKRDWTNWLKQQNQRDLADKTADHIWS